VEVVAAFRRYLGILSCAFAAAACNPGFLSLDPTSTAPPTAPSAPSFTFAGRVVSTQDGSAAVAGATVTVGDTTTTTDGSGGFSVSIGSSAAPVTVSASGHLTRTTTVAGNANRGNTIDLISTAAPFDLDFFDRLARGKEQAGVFPDFVIRWPSNPNFYVITKYTVQDAAGNFVSSAEDVPVETVNRIVALLPGLVSDITGNRIQAGSIQTRPDARPVATIESGWIQVEVANRDAGSAADLCGFGGVSIALQGSNEVVRTGFARIYNASNCGCGGTLPANIIIAHEVGHALGFGHTHPYRDSVMSYDTDVSCATASYSARDRYHGAIAYTRPLGNTSPDNDPEGFQLQRLSRSRLRQMEYACQMPGR
jgi:hypothetical protein